MARTENVELTVLCLIHKDDEYLLQDRIKEDWKGLTLPGGHIEKGESIVDAVVREMKEETGLKIFNPRLCGVKQFPIEDGRYIVFLFETEEFEGKVVSSEEGKMEWVNRTELANRNIVKDLPELIQVMVDDKLTEFQYVIEDEKWNVILK
ncbi:MAG: 8-oxo-dGTP diphosphatase [Agathobacter sp.]|nr:8-oxo-dGTP diphosphatase [Agathobacter sp.]